MSFSAQQTLDSLNKLKETLSGEVVCPGDEGYEYGITRWSDSCSKQAAYVVFPKNDQDVAEAIKFAKEQSLELAVYSGGHSFSGSSSTEGGLVIHLNKYINYARCDPEKRLLYVGGGATWEIVDKVGMEHGLATVAGTVNHTGVGGLSLGGGYGWLTGRYGMTVDNIVQLTVVLASGEIVTANEKEHPDLFWGCRGGGGNFGVVTEFVFKAHPQRPTVFITYLLYTMDKLEGVLNAIREWEENPGPDEGLHWGCMRVLPGMEPGPPTIIVIYFYNGEAAEGRKAGKMFYDIGPMAEKAMEELPFVQLNSLQNEPSGHGGRKYIKGLPNRSVPTLEAVQAVLEAQDEVIKSHPGLVHSGIMSLAAPAQALMAVPMEATAYAGRGKARLHSTTEELQEILLRNPDGPLDVIWAPSNRGKLMDDAAMSRVAMVSSQSQRWRSLVVAGRITQDLQDQLIDVPTPRLAVLNIVNSCQLHRELNLARVGAPLRELTLSGVVLDWGNPRLRCLRSLRLHDLRPKGPTAGELHAILSSAPGLEILDLARWQSALEFGPRYNDLGSLPLPSLTTLAVEAVSSTVLWMLLSCIQAPKTRYIKVPTINQSLFQDDDPVGELAKLCRGSLSTVSRLLVTYDQASGSCTLAHRETETPPQSNTRESLLKLAKRRGVFLQTYRIYFRALGGDNLRVSENNVRRFIQEVVQPVLRDLSVEVQLDLHHRWPLVSDTPSNPPKSVVTDLLMNAPVVTHLKINPYFDAMEVLAYISARQFVRTMDGEAGQDLCWPIPLMETLTVACHPINQAKILESLECLILNRGSRIYHGAAVASGQVDELGEDTSHPPRLVKHIVVQDRYERSFKLWDSEQGWRAC
ncbi:hypothetical protein FS837_005086 [Tulasnella sp. UAMH 9824]|nr:hypothetical protein FS837_005086 [Tulasnella sp. UAMH 9824]